MNDKLDLAGNTIIDWFHDGSVYECFSNFFKGAPLTLWGITFVSSEHAYQWSKTLIPEEKDYILYKTDGFIHKNTTAAQAKRRGKEITLRPDWERVRFDIMVEILRAKFSQNPTILKILLDSGDSLIIEGNNWHDNTWGACICEKCKGKEKLNLLGKALMWVRTELQNGLV